MQTIGRKYQGPSRNWQEDCDYCGVTWNRHELIIDENGYLSCPDDREGRVEKTLDYLRASGASENRPVLGKRREY